MIGRQTDIYTYGMYILLIFHYTVNVITVVLFTVCTKAQTSELIQQGSVLQGQKHFLDLLIEALRFSTLFKDTGIELNSYDHWTIYSSN